MPGAATSGGRTQVCLIGFSLRGVIATVYVRLLEVLDGPADVFGHCTDQPPSDAKTAPLMLAASSLSRNVIVVDTLQV